MSLGPIPQKVRQELYDLIDGGCEFCRSNDLENNPHHKPFRSAPGAANDIYHLVWLCRQCHRFAHNQHTTEDDYNYFRHWYDGLDIASLRNSQQIDEQ